MVKPIEEALKECLIKGIKEAYNRLIIRFHKAEAYFEDPTISSEKKQLSAPSFNIEILDPLKKYYSILKEWGVPFSDYEKMNGFKLEKEESNI